MRRYWFTAGLVGVAFLVLFVIGEALGLEAILAPTEWLERGHFAAALVGVGLLTADVVLPVPSSLVMTAHGALFGPWLGTCLSLAGSLGSALIGFGLGRAGGRWLLRLVSPAEQVRANRLLQRWGLLAVVVTRPVPLLAETVIVLAGASGLAWWRAALSVVVGALPAALVYALAGAAGAGAGMTVVIFAGVLILAGASWVLGERIERPT